MLIMELIARCVGVRVARRQARTVDKPTTLVERYHNRMRNTSDVEINGIERMA